MKVGKSLRNKLTAYEVVCIIHPKSKQANKQANKQAGKQASKQASRQAGKQAGKQAGRSPGEQTYCTSCVCYRSAIMGPAACGGCCVDFNYNQPKQKEYLNTRTHSRIPTSTIPFSTIRQIRYCIRNNPHKCTLCTT